MVNNFIFKRAFVCLVFFVAFGVFNNTLAESANNLSGSNTLQSTEKSLADAENKKAISSYKLKENTVNSQNDKEPKKPQTKNENKKSNSEKNEQVVEAVVDSNVENVILPEIDNSQVDEAINKQAENQVVETHKRNILQTLMSVCLICAGIIVIIKALIDGFKAPNNYSPGYKQKYSANNKKRKKYNIKF